MKLFLPDDVYSVRLKLCKMFHIFYVVCLIILNDLLLIRNGISKNNRFKRLIFKDICITVCICIVFACEEKSDSSYSRLYKLSEGWRTNV